MGEEEEEEEKERPRKRGETSAAYVRQRRRIDASAPEIDAEDEPLSRRRRSPQSRERAAPLTSSARRRDFHSREDEPVPEEMRRKTPEEAKGRRAPEEAKGR